MQKETSGALCWAGGGTSVKDAPNYSLAGVGCPRPALLYPLPPAVFTALGHREVLTEQKFGGCEPWK